jgi:hypothetical protein
MFQCVNLLVIIVLLVSVDVVVKSEIVFKNGKRISEFKIQNFYFLLLLTFIC